MKYFDSFEEGRFFHIFGHAVGFENLFRCAENYRYFLERYHEYIDPVAHTFCYCLMPNHFHFLVRFHLQDNAVHHKLMRPLSNLLNGYTKAYNRMFERRGALFINRTRRRAVKNDVYLNTLIDYIHENPVRSGFCQTPGEWRYSSFNQFEAWRKHSSQHESYLYNQLFEGAGFFSSSAAGLGASA
ncbi:transposase [Pedobacter yulinensis]|uniref:Transposase n=1 Tax=Pedobacter yulinensis TaxID=2126353 RepID=A0A2T3HNX0_9SPHI|nr:transposase [Pedobacter yulinensis]PST84129.1 transposase [Pedobacter yulinensis]